jgi:hypothetical protein
MAPNALTWGRDNRGAMLRVLGRAGDAGTRIENRIGEPSANPYLYIAAQIHAGLDGLARGLAAPPAARRRIRGQRRRRRPAAGEPRRGARCARRRRAAGRGVRRAGRRLADAGQALRARAPRPGRRQGRLAGARVLQPLLATPCRRSRSTCRADGRIHDLQGKAGQSLMRAAVDAGIDGIKADCGGLMTCATCHVYVDEAWAERCPSPRPTRTRCST